MKSLKLIGIAFITIIGLVSCSSNDDIETTGVYGNDVKITVGKLTPKGVTISYTNELINRSNLDVFYVITNKKTSKEKRYPVQKDLVINDLNPVNPYEIKIVYEYPKGTEIDFVSGEEFFTPSLFELTRATNSYVVSTYLEGVSGYHRYVYSHEGFSHVLYKTDTNTDTSEIYLVNSKDPNDSIPTLDLKILEDRIEFKLQEDIIPDTPYEYYRDYYIGIKTGSTYHYPTSEINILSKDANAPIKIRVFNKKPHIEEVSANEVRTPSECTTDAHYVSFKGHFFTTQRSNVGLIYKPGLTEKSDAIITRISDGKEYILQDELTNIGEHCLAYDRVSSKPFEGGLEEFPSLHYARFAYFQIPVATSDFPSGEYKVKFTFNWEGEHFETNEIPFTLQ